MTFRFPGTLILERPFAYPSAVLKRFGEEKVTWLLGLPTLFSLLLHIDLGQLPKTSSGKIRRASLS
jgi:hypothetical protein